MFSARTSPGRTAIIIAVSASQACCTFFCVSRIAPKVSAFASQ
jgi:hypothetical protein